MAKKKKRVKLELVVSEPDIVAAHYLRARFLNGTGFSMLHRYNETWMLWADGVYDRRPDEFFTGLMRRWLLKQDLYKYGRTGDLIEARCSIRVTSEVNAALISRVLLGTDKSRFFWVKEAKALAAPESIVSFKNGLLDVEQMVLHPHTPNWFSTVVLPFDYRPKDKCPKFLRWLKGICGNDRDWMECFQLWFGYNLIPDTSKQRFAHFYGPPRSGKGTATRIMSAVIGTSNCGSPTLTQLGGNIYVLAGLVGKLSAFVPDAVIGRNVDSKVVMETLSGVIGEDGVDINQKYLPTLSSVKLTVRFTVTTNEPLKWPDPTNKLLTRCLVFPFVYSFAGKEDPKIEQAVMTELPGIANWALRGLQKLKDGAHLREPIIGKQKHQLFSELDSPILVFCAQCLARTGLKGSSKRTAGVSCLVVHDVWNAWSKEEGRPTKGQTRTYVRSLVMNAFPRVSVQRRGKRGKQRPCFVGLVLTKEGKRLYKAARRRRRVSIDLQSSLGL